MSTLQTSSLLTERNTMSQTPFFEIVSLFFYYTFFFRISVVLSSSVINLNELDGRPIVSVRLSNKLFIFFWNFVSLFAFP